MANTKRVTVSKEQWDSMSSAEQALLTKLGVTPEKPKIPSHSEIKPKTFQIDPYILGVITNCKLCKASLLDYYEMVIENKERYYVLVSRQIASNVIPRKWSVMNTPTCRLCTSNLLVIKKKDIVRMLIQVASCGRVISDTLVPTYQKKELEDLPDVPDE